MVLVPFRFHRRYGFVFWLLVCLMAGGLDTSLLSITNGGWNPTKTVSLGAGIPDPAGQFVLLARMLPSSLVAAMSGPDTKSPIWIIPTRGATAGSIPQRFAGYIPAEYHGQGSSDGGAILLQAADRRLGLIEALAACLEDERQPGKVRHDRQLRS